MPPSRELDIGAVYGCLTVVREYVRASPGIRRYWCRCKCGREFPRYVSSIQRCPARCHSRHSQAVAS